MRWSLLGLPLLLLVLSGCAMNRVTAYPGDLPSEYALDTGDVVRVTVYGDDHPHQHLCRHRQGHDQLPARRAGQVRGQTVSAAERMITKLLANGYMISPKVSVEVSTYRPFFIDGAVTNGGQYPYVYGHDRPRGGRHLRGLYRVRRPRPRHHLPAGSARR